MKEEDLKILQEEIGARIESDPFLADVPVRVYSQGLVDSEIAKLLGTLNTRTGKVGAAIIVMLPSVDSANAEAPGPQIDMIPVIRCLEKPQLNREATGTKITADTISIRMLRLFHLWQCDAIGAMIRCSRTPIRPATQRDPAAIGYDVFLQAPGGFDGSRIVAPRIAWSGGMVTLTCNTPSVSIYWTVDGGYPHAGNPAATRYSTPFASAPGTLVRACAYHSIDHRRVPSDVSRLILT